MRAKQLQAKQLDEAEWTKLYYKHQQHYIRRRLLAIKSLQEGQTQQAVIKQLGCARGSLANWIDMYCQGGLQALCIPIKSNRKQKLDSEQKQELKRMLLEQKPTDYGIDRQLWTGKIIVEVIYKRWNITLKDSRIYDILKELGLSHQKAHRDYINADPSAQKQFVLTVKKKLQTLKPGQKLVFYDEFAVYDRPSLFYAWAERNTKPQVPSDEKRERNKVNGMMAVDAVTGEIYLQLQPKSKSEDVAKYFADLCKDAYKNHVEELCIILDNNSTHKDKMKKLLAEHLNELGLTEKLRVEFIHTPSYSPDFNLAEYEIHQLRLLKLHHLPADVTIAEIEKRLKDVKFLMNSDQISRTLEHIFGLVYMSTA